MLYNFNTTIPTLQYTSHPSVQAPPVLVFTSYKLINALGSNHKLTFGPLQPILLIELLLYCTLH